MVRGIALMVITAGALSGCAAESEAEASSDELAAAVDGGPARSAVCELAEPGRPLPEELQETSGLARSRREPNLFWTHNDGGNDSDLFGIGLDGSITQRLSIPGVELQDWEDIEAGSCASGTCLFLGDIGDNDAERDEIVVYRIPEPPADAATTAAPASLRGRYPEGPQDAEALIVDRSGQVYVVTKGRSGPIRLYKFPPQTGSDVATLELIKELLPAPDSDEDRITAGTLGSDGRLVGIRSYSDLYLYDAESFFSPSPARAQVMELSASGHENGESLVIGEGGVVWVTSEAGGKKESPQWAKLQCTIGD